MESAFLCTKQVDFGQKVHYIHKFTRNGFFCPCLMRRDMYLPSVPRTPYLADPPTTCS